MTLFIYRDRDRFMLEGEGGDCLPFPDEGAAISAAVELAQDAGASSYVLNYWRPAAPRS